MPSPHHAKVAEKGKRENGANSKRKRKKKYLAASQSRVTMLRSVGSGIRGLAREWSEALGLPTILSRGGSRN